MMKSLPAVLMSTVLTLGLAHHALADQQPGSMPGMNMKPTTGTTQITHSATGVVKQLDTVAGKVTISHGAIPSLSWPAMTMTFAVKDKGLLNKLAVGKTVAFQIAKEGTDYVVTSVK
jgi:Cu(I)/Ag(I) efflux system protein CusF